MSHSDNVARVPAGSPEGGRWTGSGAAVAAARLAAIGRAGVLELLRTQGDGFSYNPYGDDVPDGGYMSSIEDGPIFDPDMSDDEKLAIIDQFMLDKKKITQSARYVRGRLAQW